MNVSVSKCYLICTSPRTGSTLLTEALHGTGRAGSPEEFFKGHDSLDRLWREAFGIRREAEYLDKVLAARTGANGVFGMKLLWPQGPALIAKLRACAALRDARPDASLPELLAQRLGTPPSYIWLRRKNKLAQAISYLRAESSGIWRSEQSQRRAAAADPHPAFDFDLIVRYLRSVNGFDLEWACFFLTHRAHMLLVTYEELIASYEPTVARVLDFLEVPTDGMTMEPPRLQRQSDALSLEWEQRFLEQAAQRGLDLPELFATR